MNSAVAEAPTRTATFTDIEIDQIAESTSNPRRRFGELEELATSIREQGVLEPLIVRPHADQMHGYELVAGARRLRAAKLAGLVDVPCLVRTLTDLQVLEIQITENLQRKDVHPLEEADAYAALMHADHAYTVEAVAARVGRSTSYVYQRLKLKDLCKPAREAFEADEITAAHAVRLARLSDEQQSDALHHCFHSLFGEKKGERRPAPVVILDRWIEDHVAVDPAERDVVTHYLPEFAEQLAALEDPAAAATLVQLSDSQMPGFYLGRKDHGLIGRNSWKEVKGEKSCEFARQGAVVHGGPLRVLWVCTKKGCPKHWPAEQKAKGAAKAKAAATKVDYEAERKKAELARERYLKLKPMVMAAIAKTYAAVKLTDDLVHELVEDFEREGKPAILAAGLTISVKHAGPIIAFLLNTPNIWNLEGLRAEAKKRKVDMKALEQRLDADLKGDAEMNAGATPTPKKKSTTKRKGGKR
jgi:ParB/RepB/Spo0J family partition protein